MEFESTPPPPINAWESSMSKEKKDPEVVIMPECQAQIDANPKLAKYVREFSAIARQAMVGVENCQYKDFDDAMFALTGSRPERVDLDD